MPNLLMLAQDGAFERFAFGYCCILPLGFVASVGIVYFSIRWYVEKKNRN